MSMVMLGACAPADSGQDVRTRAPRLSAGNAPLIAAAGDIACEGAPCDQNVQTSDLIRDLDPDAVLTLGDNQYDDGRLADFMDSFDHTWGRFKRITYPAPGNHDYHVEDAHGYFDYFGSAANPPDGYYSFELGRWHLLSLNSGEGTISDEQLAWIRGDLRSDDHLCELAYWHHPRWSSGDEHGSDLDMARLWRLMYKEGVDVVLNGHEHVYERFAKLDAAGQPDPRGVREIIAGTGGDSLYGFADPLSGSRVRMSEYGVLAMVLHRRSYVWEFLRAEDGQSLDGGRTMCHK